MPDERAESIQQGIAAPEESEIGRRADEERRRHLNDSRIPPDSAMGGTSDADTAGDEAHFNANRATEGPDLEEARGGPGGAEPQRADWQDERGGRIDPLKYPQSPLDADERVDAGIAESFPASDAPSFSGGK